MQRTYRKPAVRAGLGALTALLVLLTGSGGVASASEPVRLDTMAEAAPLAQGAGFGSPAEAGRVRLVQRVLARRGWAPGPVDGLFGPRTEAAVLRFQAAAGLAVDGVVGQQTARALAQVRSGSLRRGAGYQTADGSRRVRALQRRLARAGLNPGPVDGRFGPRTEAAVARLQRTARLNASGAVDGRTRRVLARAGQPRQGARPVAAGLKTIAPRVLGSVSIRPLARPTAQTNPSVDAELALAIAAAALLAGMLCGGLWAHGRNRPAAGGAGGLVPEPRDHQPQPQPRQQQASRLDPAPEPAVSEPGRRESLRAVDSPRVPRANGHDAGALNPRDDHPQPQKPQQHQRPRRQLMAARAPLAAAPARLEAVLEPEPELAGQPDPNRGGPVRAVGYISVPKANGQSGGVLEAQADAIGRLCERRGWELLQLVRDVENGHPKGMERPGLLYALERIAAGEASCLVVCELERLSRSAADLGRIVEWIEARDARLVAIDLRLDTGSTQGRLTARTLVAVGEWEGRRIAEQTKKGLAAARARRATTGRPAVADVPALKQRIVAMRRDGMTLQAIADQLNTENTPTLRGGTQWRPSSVQAAAGYRRPKTKHTNPNPNHTNQQP
jgi:DNA invertase Pin-like site-specific DNA recombinase/peptidoglycan hydrolase-like protein with peptidoglycan-binding domain